MDKLFFSLIFFFLFTLVGTKYLKNFLEKKKIIDIQRNKTGKLFAFCCESAGFIKGQNFYKRKKLFVAV